AGELHRTQLRVALAALDLQRQVKTAYHTLCSSQQLLELERTGANAAQTAADLAQRQHDTGNISDFELASHQVAYEQRRLELDRVAAQVQTDRLELARVMGMAARAADLRVPRHLPEPSIAHLERDPIIALALAQRLDLDIARSNVQSMEQSMQLARKGIITNAGLGVAYEREPGGQNLTGPSIAV